MSVLTPYARAWAKFRGSEDYKKLRAHITDVGDPYATNRIRVAFDAGWNSKTSAILEAFETIQNRAEGPKAKE
jgi:hypothetical protein